MRTDHKGGLEIIVQLGVRGIYDPGERTGIEAVHWWEGRAKVMDHYSRPTRRYIIPQQIRYPPSPAELSHGNEVWATGPGPLCTANRINSVARIAPMKSWVG